ncbi:hypothetical protein [Azospirillum sp. ST 5-10]|uniref:hypothetical protein n=1 Tax=unclassified Azospirillum TaxID=2630922 RepID=UPI003F4A7F27
MESLWQTAWRRWLHARSLHGVDHLCDHLRRDIGVDTVDPLAQAGRDGTGRETAESIRTRNSCHSRTFGVLHEWR